MRSGLLNHNQSEHSWAFHVFESRKVEYGGEFQQLTNPSTIVTKEQAETYWACMPTDKEYGKAIRKIKPVDSQWEGLGITSLCVGRFVEHHSPGKYM